MNYANHAFVRSDSSNILTFHFLISSLAGQEPMGVKNSHQAQKCELVLCVPFDKVALENVFAIMYITLKINSFIKICHCY